MLLEFLDPKRRYLHATPKRTNVFQEVVAIIQEHLAKDATVEESGMLVHRVTGKEREVDVVIRSRVAGHDVIISVEATATGRKADTTWVEARIEKHRNLPTSKLVLVSQSGFTDPARKQAEAEKAVPLAPEDLDVEHPAFVVVNALPSLWPKELALAPESAILLVRKPDGPCSACATCPLTRVSCSGMARRSGLCTMSLGRPMTRTSQRSPRWWAWRTSPRTSIASSP